MFYDAYAIGSKTVNTKVKKKHKPQKHIKTHKKYKTQCISHCKSQTCGTKTNGGIWPQYAYTHHVQCLMACNKINEFPNS